MSFPSSMAIGALALFRATAPECQEASSRTHIDEVHGLRVGLPAGWRKVEEDKGAEGFTLYLVPPETDGRVLLGFTAHALGTKASVDALVASALAKIEQDPNFSELERGEVELLGAQWPSLRARLVNAAGVLTLEAAFLVEGERGYVIQRAAPPEEFARWEGEFARVVATFAPVAPSERGLAERRLAELAARCGSELDWAGSWEEAARRARELERPILVVAWLYAGFDLPVTPATTTFMDEDVLALVAARFVPWQYRPGEESAFVERYGLSRSGFGQGLLVTTHEGEVLAGTENATDPGFAFAFLCQTLAALPAAPPQPTGDDALARARTHLANGMLPEARKELGTPRSVEEHLFLVGSTVSSGAGTRPRPPSRAPGSSGATARPRSSGRSRSRKHARH